MDAVAESTNKPMANRRRMLRLTLGSFVFLFLLEVIFMLAMMGAAIMLTPLWFSEFGRHFHPDQMTVLTVLLTNVVFLTMGIPVILGWRRLATDKGERIMSFALVMSVLSIAYPVIPLSWNLDQLTFLLGYVVSTWPMIVVTGTLLLALSLYALARPDEAPSENQFRVMCLLLSLVVVLAAMEAVPALVSMDPFPVAMEISPFWAITQMGAFALLIEAVLQLYRMQTPNEQTDLLQN